jgi:hypothetical protein
VECLYDRIHARLVAEPELYSWRLILVAALLTCRGMGPRRPQQCCETLPDP